MKEILTFLINNRDYLFNEYGFRFVDSMVSESFGGDSYVILENDSVRIRLVSDRNQLFLDFQPKINCKEWYSIDMVNQYLTGEIKESAELDVHYEDFLSKEMADIINIFSGEECALTLIELKKLEKERAKRTFG